MKLVVDSPLGWANSGDLMGGKRKPAVKLQGGLGWWRRIGAATPPSGTVYRLRLLGLPVSITGRTKGDAGFS